jgi:hypothetical protein
MPEFRMVSLKDVNLSVAVEGRGPNLGILGGTRWVQSRRRALPHVPSMFVDTADRTNRCPLNPTRCRRLAGISPSSSEY